MKADHDIKFKLRNDAFLILQSWFALRACISWPGEIKPHPLFRLLCGTAKLCFAAGYSLELWSIPVPDSSVVSNPTCGSFTLNLSCPF